MNLSHINIQSSLRILYIVYINMYVKPYLMASAVLYFTWLLYVCTYMCMIIATTEESCWLLLFKLHPVSVCLDAKNNIFYVSFHLSSDQQII